MLEETVEEEDIIPEGSVLGGRYTIEQLIGRGGMAKVYSAYDQKLGRKIALKVLEKKHYSDKEFVKRFYREAHSVALLNRDENIAMVHDVSEIDGLHCICMEFAEGKTLDKIMKDYSNQKKFFSFREACIIIRNILEALAYAHQEGVIHRDIKPSNIIVSIIVSKQGELKIKLKITDFGIAKIVLSEGSGLEQTVLTKDFSILGTPQYMSPEQIRLEKVSGKTDVFSVGVILYEMLTGRLPFGNIKEMSITTKVTNTANEKLKSPRTINKKIPQPLEDILLKALEKNPEKRYDAEGFYKALDSYLKDETVKVEGSFRRRFVVKRREFLIKGGLALLGLTALIWAPTFIITKHNAYEKSIYSTIDRIQLPEINSMVELTSLLTKECPKFYNRLEWIYDVELAKQLKLEEKKEKSMIYPLGSSTVPGRDGGYSYLTGEGGFTGFICPIIYYLFDEIENRIQHEKGIKQKIQLQEKSKKILNDFFSYATHLYFVEQKNKGDGITLSDEETLVLDRFYYPAKEVIINIPQHEPNILIKRGEVNKIISNYAKAIKLVLEKRYNPKKRFIEQTGFNQNEVNVVRDSGIALMLCDGFRLLDINKQVLSGYKEYGAQVRNIKDYLDLIISDADVKISKLVKSDTWKKEVTSKDYIGLILGLVHRRNLIRDILQAKDTKYNRQNVFSANISNLVSDLGMEKNKSSLEYKTYLANKKGEYEQIIQGMINYLIPKISNSTILGYYLEERPSNPRDTIATLRLLEAITLYDESKIQNINLENIAFRVYKDLFSRYILSGKNTLPVSAENPFGFVKDTRIHIQYVQAAGGTCIESDYLFLKNILSKFNEK